jgi:OOP family OmpA-OmpF porin
MGAVSFGYFFTPVVGARVQGNGSQWKANLPYYGATYKSKFASIDIDLLLNFSNMLFPNRNNFLNVIGVIGAPFGMGVPHYWIMNYAQEEANGNKWSKGWKGGGMIELNLTKHIGFNIEGGVNYIQQEESLIGKNEKWWPYAMAGLTYKFGFKKEKKVAPEPATVMEDLSNQNTVNTAAANTTVKKPEPKPEPKPVVKPAPAKMTQNIFFKIGRSAITEANRTKIDEIAQWAKDHPTANFAVTGYADKGTGTAKINKAISERRAAAVKDALVKKGVAASRISTAALGDTVQPFANNDDNRVVITIGEEK